MSAYKRLSRVLSLAVVGVGIALLVVTAIHGGGETGFVLGLLFVAAGGGRLYLSRERTR